MATKASSVKNPVGRKGAPTPKMPQKESSNGAPRKGVKGGKTGDKVDVSLPKDKQTEYKKKFKEIIVELYHGQKKAPLTVSEVKALLGYEEEPEGQSWPEGYELGTTYNKKKFRCVNNPSNRPFRIALAKRYASEIVRNKWKFNGETFVFDWFGHAQQGQHRLIGVILAEELRQQNPEKWATQYGMEDEVTIECLIVKGIDPAVADTMDLGQKRSFGDVLYRDPRFTGEGVDRKKLKRLSDDLAIAARLAWIRAGGKKVSDADWFPVSEGLDFIELHPKLVDAVEYIDTIDKMGDGGQIKAYVSRGYAAALLYLMGMSATDPDEFQEEGSGALDDSLWGKAQEFWGLIAGKGKLPEGSPIYFLRDILGDIESSSGAGRDEKVATIVKAFNMWMDKKTIKSTKDLRIEKKLSDAGKYELTEAPRLGGIDVEREKPKKSKDSAKKANGDAELPDIPEGTKVTVEDPTGDWTGTIVSNATYGDGRKTCEVKADSDKEVYEMPRDQITVIDKQGPGKKNKQPVKDFDRAAIGVRRKKGKWQAGDTAWVNNPEGEPYFAEILEAAAHGEGGTVKDLQTEEVWDVSFEDLSETYPEVEDSEEVVGQHAKPRNRK